MFEQEDTKPGVSTSFAIEQGLRAAAAIGEDQLARVTPALREAFSSTTVALLYLADLVLLETAPSDTPREPAPGSDDEAPDPRDRWRESAAEQLRRAADSLDRE